MKHKLLTKKAKHLRPNVVFATDGPWDLRDFATKSFICLGARNPRGSLKPTSIYERSYPIGM
jgi:hypothetical protein